MRGISVCCVLISVLSAQTDWVAATTSGPSARSSVASAYDSLRGRTLIYGGRSGGGAGGILSDFWSFDGTTWTLLSSSAAPGPRAYASMVYDSGRDRLVLFGGGTGSGWSDETWEFDGASWTQFVGPGPSPRGLAGLAYDSVRGRTVLHGGEIGFFNPFSDTWEFDGVAWTFAGGGPGGRSGPVMEFDSNRGKVVMVGGYAGSGSSDNTWEFDASGWSQVFTQTSPATNGQGAFDSVRGVLVMLVGLPSGTMEYNGVDWSVVATPTSPSSRLYSAMTFDSARGRTVLFGGEAPSGPGGLAAPTTWEYYDVYGAQPAVATAYGSGCGTTQLAMLPLSNPIIGTSPSVLVGNAPSLLAAIAVGNSDSTWSGGALPLDLTSIGMTGCDLLQSADSLGFLATPATATTLAWQAPIPYNPSLLSLMLYLQCYCLAPGVNPAQIVTSNGVAWTIGNQ